MRKALNRKPLEDKIINVLQRGRHPLEAFTSLDYYLAGADRIWNAAFSKLRRMPNYELVGICKNIDAEDTYPRKFGTYYDLFNYRLAE